MKRSTFTTCNEPLPARNEFREQLPSSPQPSPAAVRGEEVRSFGPSGRVRLGPSLALWAALIFAALGAGAQPLLLPTANRALFEPGGEERFFVGTVGKPWTSGTFGCVRTDGWQLHEGLDIRALERDKRGEPTDLIRATADGTVAYINKRPSLSNYGNYLILRHMIEGVELYSLYAHLKEFAPGLKHGDAIKGGDVVATMGRTSNTGQGISKERAHVHFELDLIINERFPQWYRKTFPGQRNDHGGWNGQNLIGLDPRLVLLEQEKKGAKFSLVQFIRDQTELCRVLVRGTNCSWARRYPMLLKANATAEKEGLAGYELALNFNGLPFEVIPRAASEIKTKASVSLLSVNEVERQKNPCRKLVLPKGSRWELANNGLHLLNLLTY
jgi:peptidoglycan LD-endopeptidase LytH